MSKRSKMVEEKSSAKFSTRAAANARISDPGTELCGGDLSATVDIQKQQTKTPPKNIQIMLDLKCFWRWDLVCYWDGKNQINISSPKFVQTTTHKTPKNNHLVPKSTKVAKVPPFLTIFFVSFFVLVPRRHGFTLSGSRIPGGGGRLRRRQTGGHGIGRGMPRALGEEIFAAVILEHWARGFVMFFGDHEM